MKALKIEKSEDIALIGNIPFSYGDVLIVTMRKDGELEDRGYCRTRKDAQHLATEFLDDLKYGRCDQIWVKLMDFWKHGG